MKKLFLSLALLALTLNANGARVGDYDLNDGGSMDRQYIKNGNATANVAGWTRYNDAAGVLPVDGTGGSPVITWTRQTSSPITNSAGYFELSKGATNRQGDGVCYLFTLDSADKTAPSTARFSYETSTNYVDGDVVTALIDTTSGEVIQPSASSLKKTSGVARSQPMEFQFRTNTSYRWCFHVASTNASAYTIKFARIEIKPTTYAVAPTITSWSSSQTPSGSVTNATRTTWIWRQVGADIEVRTLLTFTGAGSLSTMPVAALIPSGMSVDTSRLAQATGTPNYSAIGNAYSLDVGTADYTNQVLYNSTSSQIAVANQTNAPPFTPGNTDQVTLNFRLPILGLDSNRAVIGVETDGRSVVALYSGTASATSSTSAPIQWNTKVIDTHGSVTTGSGWRFTAKVDGTYAVSHTAYLSSAATSTVAIYKNGTLYLYTGGSISNQFASGGTTFVPLVANDYIDLRTVNSQTIAADANNNISITRISSSTQIQAGERVYLLYTGNAATALTANVTNIDFSNRVIDSHAAWNGTTFTAPRNGWYTISGSIAMTGSNANSVSSYVGGSLRYSMSTPSSNTVKSFSGGIYLNQGEALTFRQDSGGVTLSNSSSAHWISISSQEGGPGSGGTPNAVTSSVNNSKLESVCVGGNSTCTADCTSSPCTLSGSNTSWVAITRSATGTYQATMSGFSAKPLCWGQAQNGDYLPLRFDNSTATATLLDIITKTSGAAAADTRFNLFCTGPK